MEVLAKGKYIKVSPKKARALANLVRGKNANSSVVMLDAMPQAGAGAIKKVLLSAMANAENNFNLEKSELVISKITVDAGPVLKRFQPRAKGSASQIKKRTSHIEIIVAGDVKTKKAQKTTPETKKVEVADAKQTKVEVERPVAKQNVHTAPKGAGANKMYRRKTG